MPCESGEGRRKGVTGEGEEATRGREGWRRVSVQVRTGGGVGYDLSFKFHITQLPIARVLSFLGDAHTGNFD